jgi:hypothetical protein
MKKIICMLALEEGSVLAVASGIAGKGQVR